MPDRFDTLFSPDRLRQNWRPQTDRNSESGIAVPQGAMNEFAFFSRLIGEKFPTEKESVFQVLLNDLEEQLKRRFPENGEPHPPPEEIARMNAEIGDLINRIEDLTEAMELKK